MKVILVLLLTVLLGEGIYHVTFCLFDAGVPIQTSDVSTSLEQTMSIPFLEGSWVYSVDSLIVGFLVYLLMYYRMIHDDKLFSHEKLGLVLGVVQKTQTPLVVIQNLLEDVTTGELPEPTLKKMKHVLRHVYHLADCYKVVTTLERDKKEKNTEVYSAEYELYSYIISIINQCRPYADLREIQLNVNKHFEYVKCQIDDTLMPVALQYLLWKIIDITPSKNNVNIDVMHSGGYWHLQIMNYREGDKDNREMLLSISGILFVYFCRSIRIIRKIVRQQGGKVTLKSRGRRVQFQIATPLNGHEVSIEFQSMESAKEKNDEAFSTYEEEENDMSVSSIETARQYHILLVMSDQKLSDYLSETLSTHFYVTILEQPENVFYSINQRRPDAIIIDETINGVYGKDLCSEIKSATGATNIPVILLVGSHDSYLIHFRCGADRLDFRGVNVSRLKVDIQALIDIYANQRRLIDNLLANHFLANQPEILDKSDDGTQFMAEVQKHLERILSTEGYTIDMLSADMAMSRTRFYTKIREITGKSPVECINSFKMYRAKILLATEQYSVTEVANLLGYCDAKYFGKVFKKYYHVSPSEYVKNIIGK